MIIIIIIIIIIDSSFAITKIATTALHQMTFAENDKYKISDYKHKDTYVNGIDKTKEMNSRRYQLLHFVMDSGGRLGPIASDFYYGEFNLLYQHHPIESKLDNWLCQCFNEETIKLIPRSFDDKRIKNIFSKADKNWEEIYPRKWYTNTHQAQMPSQWAEQVIGSTFYSGICSISSGTWKG